MSSYPIPVIAAPRSAVASPRLVCLHFPQWPVARQARRRAELGGAAVVIAASVGQRRQIVDAADPARAMGIRPGMSLAEARALGPGIVVLEQDAAGDRRALEALGRWLTRFTPVVATGWTSGGEPPGEMSRARGKRSKAPPGPAAARAGGGVGGGGDQPFLLFLDITGSERLFGSSAQLAQRIARCIQRLGIPVRSAVAPTPGAAWALASSGAKPIAVAGPGQLASALAPLPVESLRLAEDIVFSLRHLGIRTIGQLCALPRDELPARFGPTLLLRLQQALGDRSEPLVPLGYDPPITARMELDGPVSALEGILAIFQVLLRQVAEDLTRRGRGAVQLDLVCTFDRDVRRPDVTQRIQLSRPCREFSVLFNLARCALERLDGGRSGFVCFAVKVPAHESLAHEQADLFGGSAQADQIELDRLIERLRVRFGQACLVRPRLAESYLPERAWKPGEETTRCCSSSSPGPARSQSPLPAAGPLHRSRPLHLRAMPVEVRVISEPSDARVGSPRQFTCNGRVHRVALALGPERIAGEWWRGHPRTRDYYEVENTAGQRFWIFRVVRRVPAPTAAQPDRQGAQVRWFLHGYFQ